MSSLDTLLDTTWSLYYVSEATRHQTASPSILRAVLAGQTGEDTKVFLRQLSRDCHDYLTSHNPILTDDLNDLSEKRGALQECKISQIWHPSPPVSNEVVGTGFRQSVGLLFEIHFQKTTYRVVLLYRAPATITGISLYSDEEEDVTRLSLVLFKAPANYIRQISEWLAMKFAVSPAAIEPLRLSANLVLEICSQYLAGLSASWTFSRDGSGSDALDQATLKHVVGNLKLTITVTETAKAEIGGKLKTIDLDMPCETVYNVLGSIRQRQRQRNAGSGGGSDTIAFLDELAEAIRLRTGLRLPLNKTPTPTTAQAGSDTTVESELPVGPPLEVTRVSCVAFAIGIDGRVKLVRRPIENAETIGYDEDLVKGANWNVLNTIQEEAKRRSESDGGAG